MKRMLTIAAIIAAFFMGMAVQKNVTHTPTETTDIIDLNKVIGWESSEYGLQLYYEDGSGYWLEK